MTDDGSALQSYQFLCSALGGRFTAEQDDTPVVFIPDAGLVGAAGQEWQSLGQLAAYHRTPFEILGADGCQELRSVPQDWPIRVTCDLDGVPIDFVTLQGCESEGTYYRAVGRPCTFFDFDINTVWEQWWIEAPAAEDYGHGPFVLETDGTTRLWRITPDSHRDDRCATPPIEWPSDWRYEE